VRRGQRPGPAARLVSTPRRRRWLMRPGGLGQAATAPGRPVVLLMAGHDHGAAGAGWSQGAPTAPTSGMSCGRPAAQGPGAVNGTCEITTRMSFAALRAAAGIGESVRSLIHCPNAVWDLGEQQLFLDAQGGEVPFTASSAGAGRPESAAGWSPAGPAGPSFGSADRMGGPKVNGRLAHRARCVP
jgi:hypothetical protein